MCTDDRDDAGDTALEELLTREDLARILNCSTRTVDRLVAAGEVPAIHIGRLVRFLPSRIRRLLDEQRDGTEQ